jgi:hypothetical protein
VAQYTIRYNKNTNHIQGLSEKLTSSQFNYATSACPALSRSGTFMSVGFSTNDINEAVRAANSGTRNACKTCLKKATDVKEATQ